LCGLCVSCMQGAFGNSSVELCGLCVSCMQGAFGNSSVELCGLRYVFVTLQ